MKRTLALLIATFILAGLAAAPTRALDDKSYAHGTKQIEKGIAYLRQAQADDGSWTPRFGPAVTALVITGMLDRPDIGPTDPAVAKAIDYILAQQQESGQFGKILPNYNTAICLSALARVKGRVDVAKAIEKGEAFLRSLQNVEGKKDPDGETITRDHPFYGGAGYGNHGRPDGSNTQMFTQALHDLGVDCNDQAMQDAVVYMSRLQGIKENEMFGDKIVNDGGAIYATSVNKENVGVPESRANPDQIERVRGGKDVNSKLSTHGSMTYAMFKTYVYANLDRDDVRVTSAVDWIRKNYTVDHNAGMPEEVKRQGHFYYLMTMARALKAWNADIVGADGKVLQWDDDIVAKLGKLQRKDGSWVNEEDRYGEGDANLVTAYAIIALNNAVGI